MTAVGALGGAVACWAQNVLGIHYGCYNSGTACHACCLQCKAFTWDGTCGYLKAAGAPRRPQQGITSVVFTPAGSADAIVAAQRNDTGNEAGSADSRPDNVNTSLPGV